jgi:hypothetical protein
MPSGSIRYSDSLQPLGGHPGARPTSAFHGKMADLPPKFGCHSCDRFSSHTALSSSGSVEQHHQRRSESRDKNSMHESLGAQISSAYPRQRPAHLRGLAGIGATRMNPAENSRSLRPMNGSYIWFRGTTWALEPAKGAPFKALRLSIGS